MSSGLLNVDCLPFLDLEIHVTGTVHDEMDCLFLLLYPIMFFKMSRNIEKVCQFYVCARVCVHL